MNGGGDSEILHNLLTEVGRIGGKVDAIHERQKEQTSWLGKVDSRLRLTEEKSARHALISAALVSGAVVFVTEWFKAKVR